MTVSLVDVLKDLLIENDRYGGCPPSSPAWDLARRELAKRVGPNWADRYTEQEHERALDKLWSDMGAASVPS